MSSEVKPWRDVLIANYCTNVPGAVVWIIVLIKLARKENKMFRLILIAALMITFHTFNIAID
jgi:hypothetical protein